MNILVLNGSPRKNGNTAAMVRAFAEGAREGGHEVEVIGVGRMDIAGCLGCECCHNRNDGVCILEDDMRAVYRALEDAEVMILASPMYFHNITGPLQSTISRVYAIGKPPKLVKCGMLLSSRIGGIYDGISEIHRTTARIMGVEDIGIVTSCGTENATPERRREIVEMGFASGRIDEEASRRKLDEVRAFGRGI